MVAGVRLPRRGVRCDEGGFFFSSRRRHTRCGRDWSSDVCSSDLEARADWRRVTARALAPSFYARPTPEVARRLLGHVLVSEVGGRRVAGRIVETEAYVGPDHPARHRYGAHPTRRNRDLFWPPGTRYVQ